MPNWKKVAVSGSAASFSSLNIDTSITASIVSSSQFTGSLFGTASYAVTSSYLNPVTSGYVVLTQVSQSLNFTDDAAAAANGIPLGGLYRNGNFILIRIS